MFIYFTGLLLLILTYAIAVQVRIIFHYFRSLFSFTRTTLLNEHYFECERPDVYLLGIKLIYH